MNNVPSMDRLRSTLAAARKLIADIAAREDQLVSESERRRAFAARATGIAKTRLQDEIIVQRQELTDRQREESDRALKAAQTRKDRIQKAHLNCRRRITLALDQKDGRAVFGFQKGTLDTEKRRETDLADAANRFAETSSAVSGCQNRWAATQAALRRSFGAFREYRRWLEPNYPWSAADTAGDETELLRRVEAQLTELDACVAKARGHLPLRIFRLIPIWLVVLVSAMAVPAAVWGAPYLGRPASDLTQSGTIAGGILGAYLVLRFIVRQQLRDEAKSVARRLSEVHQWLASATEKTSARYHSDTQEAETRFKSTTQSIRDRWSEHEDTMAATRSNAIQALNQKTFRVTERHERLGTARAIRLTQAQAVARQVQEQRIATDLAHLESQAIIELSRIQQETEGHWAVLEADWLAGLAPIRAYFSEIDAATARSVPDWDTDYWRTWEPPNELGEPAVIGNTVIDIRNLAPTWPRSPRLAFPTAGKRVQPLWLAYPSEGSVVIESEQGSADEIGAWLNHIALRLLCQMPPGRLKVTVLDPVGLGRNFANLMHLADYAEANSGTGQRIWTEPAEIEERLTELTQQLEKVLQMYLRNEFANLVEYNTRAGSIAEHHHLLIVTGFPVNFSESAARRLHNLITNGGRCGILTLLHWDRRLPAPAGFIAAELQNSGLHLVYGGKEINAVPSLGTGVRLALSSPPPAGLATELLHRIGRASHNANQVIVPFEIIAPDHQELWRETTQEEIRVPLGRTGASKLQYLSLGRGTRQHALISGKTGSGKSNLLHVIITNLALRCSPAELEFYLVDFKKGVEFKSYATARLPHARVVAIESDREFGLSVLERIDLELRRRGELFRALGVQDVPGYRRSGGLEPMPRCLLLVDEFQEFFVQEDRVAQNSAVLLDRIVRQGRAFGIHIILASQTLGGTYALARATMGQMAVRIAFHCDEADAYLIMGDENPAPRLLSRPGEGIYNDSAGALEANSPFQAVWLPDDIRAEKLSSIRAQCAGTPWESATPVVFEGSAPANIEDNPLLRTLLDHRPKQAPAVAVAWLGAPNSIKGPTAAAFPRSSGANLLIIGQREESALSLVASALISLSAQHPAHTIRFVVADASPPGTARSELLERVLIALPHSIERVTPGRLPQAMASLTAEVNRRVVDGTTGNPSLFLVILGLQQCKKLKPDDSFGFSSEPVDASENASAAFQTLYVEGPANGIHCIAQVDSYNNVNRYLGRKGLSEFDQRVLLQMSASDSSSLCDQPIAANLGLYTALFHNEREGHSETFRPYSLPEAGWLGEVSGKLKMAETDTQ